MIITKWVTLQCRVKDGLATAKDLSRVAASCDAQLDDNVGGEEEGEGMMDTGEEHEVDEEELSEAVLEQRIQYAKAEERWTNQAAKVDEITNWPNKK